MASGRVDVPRRLVTVAAVIGIMAPASRAPAAFVFTGFGPGTWPMSDAALGIAGLDIETFEDVSLVPGLKVEIQTPTTGNFGPACLLPNVFQPILNDPNGTAFNTGIWDGSAVLVNTVDNLSHGYTAVGEWGDVTLHFSPPQTKVGFSVQQMALNAPVSINGLPQGNLLALAGLSLGTGRNGYIVIAATAGDTISSVTIDNGPGDGWVMDHLAFTKCLDIDGDSFVGIVEMLSLLQRWGPAPGNMFDLDCDGDIDIVDFLTFLTCWGPC